MGEQIDNVWAIYRRMARALDKGQGVRLSADDLWTLYTMDTAITGAVENARDYDAAREEADDASS